MSEEKFEQVFQVSQACKLEVGNIRGSTRLQAGEDGQIHVVALKDTSSGDEKRTEIEMTQAADGLVQVKTRYPEGSFGWLSGSKPCKVEYVITTPRNCTLKISGVSNDTRAAGFEGTLSFHSVSGDISLEDLAGDLLVNTVSGNARCKRIAGKINLHTVSGNVDCQVVSGSVHVETVSGDVHLLESTLLTVDATSVSGNLKLETSLGEGPYHFHSVSGNVQLSLPSETHCSAELHSVSGRIMTTLPASSLSHRHGNQKVEIQGGGARVFLSSVSGELILNS